MPVINYILNQCSDLYIHKLLQYYNITDRKYDPVSFNRKQSIQLLLDANPNTMQTGGSKPMEINNKLINKWSAQFNKSKQLQLAQLAVVQQDPEEVMLIRDANPSASATLPHVFSLTLSKNLTTTEQKMSGRCWIFAGVNVLRYLMIKKFSLPDSFELSQSYVYFYDRLERTNYILNRIIETKNKPYDSRIVSTLLNSSTIGDGGQWDMFVNIINKYGIVPKSAYGESWSSERTAEFGRLLYSKIREWAEILRHSKPSKYPELLNKMLSKTYDILLIHFGTPPKKFDWKYYTTKNKTYKRFTNLTPKNFFKRFVPYDINDQICLIHDPRNPYWKLYSIHMLNNMEGKKLLYLNVPMKEIKKYTIKTLLEDNPVWFGCDVKHYYHNNTHIWDTEQYNHKLVFDTTLNQSKASQLKYGNSVVAHAMVITGCDISKIPKKNFKTLTENPTKWRIENSWGKSKGKNGYAIMTDKYFEKYVYQVIISKKLLFKNDIRYKKILENTKLIPKNLPLWDPLGTLA